MFEQTFITSRCRRLGTIAKTDSFAYQRIIHLPTDLAVIYSVVQNFRIDLAKGYHSQLSDWARVQESYFTEVGDLLRDEAANYYPGDNAEPWIHVRNIGKLGPPSLVILQLKEIFDVIFSKNEVSLLDSEFFPTPATCRKAKEIKRFHDKMIKHMQMH